MKETFDLEEQENLQPSERSKIPSFYILLVLGYLMVLGVLTALIDDALPNAVTVKVAGITRFSEERAWVHLRDIVGTGPRVSGTKYHLTKTVDLKAMLDKIAEESDQKILVDWQFVSGDFLLKSQWPFLNAYGNLSNIMAVLEGESGFHEDGSTNTSILFNCHYDSVPTSPGASDNALFCATLVETLYLFSKQKNKFKHNIVFLFNGAEENPLQGAAGFLKHPWCRGVTALVNLDAAGTNCKSMLFQVTDPRVVSSYAKAVSRPSAQSLGEVLFASGIIPSDTDFRIFRDFGEIYGVDIAFSKVGHVYHTRFDSLNTIKGGVLQHSGDMIYELAKEMANSDLYYTKSEPSTTIYWDYMNLFMFNYDFTTAAILDFCIIVFGMSSVFYYFSIVGFRKSMYWELGRNVCHRLAAAVAGLLFVILITLALVLTSHQLRYLTNSWLVVPMFWFPFVVGSVLTSQFLDYISESGLNRVRRMAQAMCATRCLLVLVSIVLLCVPKYSTIRYLLTLPLFFMTISAFVSLSAIKHLRLKAYQQLILELIMSVPAQMLFFVVAIKINSLMLPIMGRSPTLKPDYMVAGLNILVALLSSIPLSGVELLFSRSRIWICAAITIVICLAVSFAPMPLYSDDPSNPVVQRHYWFHSEIISFNYTGEQTDRQSGIWFAHTEVNTPRSVLEHAAKSNIDFARIGREFRCENYTYCNMPMFYPRTLTHVKNSVWVDWEAPSISNPPPLFTLTKKTCSLNRCTLEFSMNGPPHMAISIWPRDNVTLGSWSFESPVDNNTVLLGRPVYFIYYARGTHVDQPEPKTVSFTFEGDITKQGIVDISFHAHRIQHPEEFTDSYRKLVSTMPTWFNIATFLSTRYNYVF